MQEMDRRVGFLRLMLADITDRERQTGEATKQLRTQLTHVADVTAQFNGAVATALAAMSEIEERLAQQDMLLRHLGMLRRSARAELDALLVTRDIAAARDRLVELEAQRQSIAPGAPDAVQRLAGIDAEMRELRSHIEAASDIAARSLASHTGDHERA
ncbi:MAG TPA: hypothetical protein VKQ30_05500 [Ktedonobacterales bacterium]|nr:hypothetical protein [Ktedonobacterales bacterium]